MKKINVATGRLGRRTSDLEMCFYRTEKLGSFPRRYFNPSTKYKSDKVRLYP